MRWQFIDPDLIDKSIFGLNKVYACKVAEWNGKSDVRGYSLNGWLTFADLLEYDPRKNKKLAYSKWYVFAVKGE